MSADGDWFLGGHLSQGGGILSAIMYFGVFYSSGTGAGIGAIDAQAPGYIGPHSGQSTWIYFHWPQCLISPPITLVFQDGNSQAKFSPNNPPYNTITFPTAPPLTISHW